MASRVSAFYASTKAMLLSPNGPPSARANGLTKKGRSLPFSILALVVAFCDIKTRACCTLLNRQAYSYFLRLLYRNLVFSRKAQIGLFKRSILEQHRHGKAKDALHSVQTFQYTPIVETQIAMGDDHLRQLRGFPAIDESGNHLLPNLRKASLNIFVNNGAIDLEALTHVDLNSPGNKGQDCFLSRVRMLHLQSLACHNAGTHRLPLKFMGLGNITSIHVKPSLETGPYPDIFRLFQDAYYLQSITVDLQDHVDSQTQTSNFLRRHMQFGPIAKDVLELIYDFKKLATRPSSSLQDLIFKIREDQAYFRDYIELVLQHRSQGNSQAYHDRVKWKINVLLPSDPVLTTAESEGTDKDTRDSIDACSRCALM